MVILNVIILKTYKLYVRTYLKSIQNTFKVVFDIVNLAGVNTIVNLASVNTHQYLNLELNIS